MFRTYYELKFRNINRELYLPSQIHKVYNYIRANNIDLTSVEKDQIISINNSDQLVLRKDDKGLFIAPGVEISNTLVDEQYSAYINGNQYLLNLDAYDTSLDNLLVGAIVLPGHNKLFKVDDTCRLINTTANLINMKYIHINNIEILNGKFLHNENSTVLYFEHTDSILDWLVKAGDISIHSITFPKKDVDVRLYLRSYGGSPKYSIENTLPQYNLRIVNKTTNEENTTEINQFHFEKLTLKHQYEIYITDQLNDYPVIINNLANNGEPIIINLNEEIKFIANNFEHKPTLPQFNEIYTPLIS